MSETSKIPSLESLLTEDFFSPYRIAKFESELRGVTIPPQKLYGYVRNGYIKVTKNSTGKLQISKTEAEAYLQKFVK